MAALPRPARRDRPITNAHGVQATSDNGTIAAITIADEIPRLLIPVGTENLIRVDLPTESRNVGA